MKPHIIFLYSFFILLSIVPKITKFRRIANTKIIKIRLTAMLKSQNLDPKLYESHKI